MKYVEHISSAHFEFQSAGNIVLKRLDIELTERCNNNCIHCCINLPAWDRQAMEEELGTDDLKRIIKEAADLGALEVRFTGGEPLLRPDFQDLYLFARRQGLKVILFTNGRLISPELADLFARIPPLRVIEITVYGMHADSYESVSRIPGSFRQFWRGVEVLRERNVVFAVKGVLLPQTRHERDEFKKWAAILPWSQKSPYVIFLDKRNRRDDPEKDRTIEDLRINPVSAVEFIAESDNTFQVEMENTCRRLLGPPGDVLFGCGAGNAVCVDAYGRLQPCMGLRAPEFTYDLLQGSLKEGIRFFSALLSQLRAINPEYLKRCARCFIRSLCYQCPARSWGETQRLDSPLEYYCSIAHAMAVRLGLMDVTEKAWEISDWKSRIKRAVPGN